MSSVPQKIYCLIIDDEPMAQEVLSTHIASIPELEISQVCNNAIEAFEALHKRQIDLVFLDVNMPVVSGLSFLRSLKKPPAVILTTAYPEYALEGYDLDVVDYLLKPIPPDRLRKAVNKAIARLSNSERTILHLPSDAQVAPSLHGVDPTPEKTFFFVKAEGKLVKISYADVRYVEGMKDYLKIHLSSGHPVVTHYTMKSMEDQLPSDRFMRVHKSYIIALHAIRAIDNTIVYIDKAEIPLGSTYRDKLMHTINTRL